MISDNIRVTCGEPVESMNPDYSYSQVKLKLPYPCQPRCFYFRWYHRRLYKIKSRRLILPRRRRSYKKTAMFLIILVLVFIFFVFFAFLFLFYFLVAFFLLFFTLLWQDFAIGAYLDFGRLPVFFNLDFVCFSWRIKLD